MPDDFIRRYVEIKRLAVTVLQTAFANADDILSKDLEGSFKDLDRIMDTIVPEGLRDEVVVQMKKIIAEIFVLAQEHGISDDEIEEIQTNLILGNNSTRTGHLPNARVVKMKPKEEGTFHKCVKQY